MTAVDAQVVSSAWIQFKQSKTICAKKHKIDEPHLSRRKNIPNRYMIGKTAGEHPENVEEEYQRQYYAALDSVITCIKEWFEQKDYEIYATLEQLLIKAILGESFVEELQKVIGFHHDDFIDDILRAQLRTLPAVIGQGEGSVNTFHDYEYL